MLTGRDPATGRPLAVETAAGRVVGVRGGPADDPAWLSPGLIDLQVNGFAGHDVNADTVDTGTVAALAHALHEVGVTTFLPTITTAAQDHIVHALRAIAAARAADPLVAHAIPAVHVEGPYLSEEDGARGVHPLPHIRPPSLAELAEWQATCGGLVGVVTLSPHHRNAIPYITAAAASGVTVAIGHTHASPEQITAATDAGATLSTHLGNGAHAVLPRHPNYLWAQLAEDRLTASFIADGHHLAADTLTAMLRAKGLARSVLVSDSTAVAGLPPGEYDTPVGGRVVLSPDGRLSKVGTPYLAGAACSLADGVARVTRLARLPLADAITLATTNPARFITPGAGPRGILRPGAPADVVRFHWQPGDPGLAIDKVYVAGTRVR